MTAFKLKQSDTGVWYVHWTDGRRSKRVSTRSKDERAAKAFRDEWASLDRAHKATLKQPATCEEIWEFYLSGHVNKRCVTKENHRYAWARLAPIFASLKPADVTGEIVARHVKARFPTKPSSLWHEFGLLIASWNFAVKRKLIKDVDLPPIDSLELPRPPLPRARWLREHEVDRLFAQAAIDRGDGRLSRVERFIWVALHTAARRGAILELTWEQVDFETRVIHFNPDGRPQTSKKRVSVPIANALLPILERAYQERTSVFVLDLPRRLPDALNALAARAGVEGVTAHVFRHTAATWMARRSVPLWIISKILGNSLEQVEKTYAKHCPDDLREVVEMISNPKPSRLALLLLMV